MPSGVRTVDDDMGVIEQPGDVLFFMDGAQTHGTLPWNADHDRRSVLYKYAGRTATRSGRSARLAPPEIYWGGGTGRRHAPSGAGRHVWPRIGTRDTGCEPHRRRQRSRNRG